MAKPLSPILTSPAHPLFSILSWELLSTPSDTTLLSLHNSLSSYSKLFTNIIVNYILNSCPKMYNKFRGKSWSVNCCVKNEHNFPFFFLFGNIFFKTTYIACKVFFRGRRFSSKCFRYNKITKNKINKDKFCVFFGPHCFCFIGQVCLGKVASGHTLALFLIHCFLFDIF